ncbi:hypothetical protein GKZ68_10400 [Hymenobacter sp. BRD128]|uniref:hypothetical protein n=1 Tax=Hymenobacter sp. BRD128 TaxID=2675878 RepID=UPI0015641775|nr:hypothetical protein [Hymenobacter sp. BRD128]QKG57000.1 hypothetical protein GKZ68_10400 [Hymenobacter sp. BRD128]
MNEQFIIGLAATIILGLIGSLLKRSIDSLDKKLDTTCNAVEAMKLEMVGYQKLTEYLKADVESGKQEISTLRKSFTEMDKLIYAKGWQTGHPVPPPRD